MSARVEPPVDLMVVILGSLVFMLVGVAFAAITGFSLGVPSAGPGCPDMPGVCPGDGGYYMSPGPGHDSGDILA